MANKENYEMTDVLRSLRYDTESLKKMKELAQSEKLKLEMHKLEIMNELRMYECMLRDLKAGKTVSSEEYFNRPHVRQEVVPDVYIPEAKTETDPDTVNRERIDIGLRNLQCLMTGEIYVSDQEENDEEEEEEEEEDDKDNCVVVQPESS